MTVAESNDALKVSLGYLEKSINEFGIPESVDLEGLKEKSEGIPEGDQVDEIIKDIGRERTSWENYWASITKDEETDASAGNERMPLNRYFMPQFWDYFKQYMLPTITMWSSICLGDLNRFNKEYKKHLRPVAQKGKTYLTQNLTNAQVEQFFELKKQDKSTTPLTIDEFIHRCWKDNHGLRRQYISALFKGLKDDKHKVLGAKEVQRMEMIILGKSVDKKFDDSQCTPNVKLPEEEWNKNARPSTKKDTTGRYQKPPDKPIHFNPISKKHQLSFATPQESSQHSEIQFGMR